MKNTKRNTQVKKTSVTNWLSEHPAVVPFLTAILISLIFVVLTNGVDTEIHMGA